MPSEYNTILSTKIQNFHKKTKPHLFLTQLFLQLSNSESLQQILNIKADSEWSDSNSHSQSCPLPPLPPQIRRFLLPEDNTVSLKKSFSHPEFKKIVTSDERQLVSGERKVTFLPNEEDAEVVMLWDVFLDYISVKEFAEDWSYMDFKYFMEIPRTEFVCKETPFWDRMTERSNMLSRWVASQIVHNANLRSRVLVFEKLIDIMAYFWELGNFNGCMCVWGGLHTLSVARLSTTRNALSPRTLSIIETFTSRLSEAANFSPLTAEFDRKVAKEEPFLPWIELLTKNRNMALERVDYLPSSDIAQNLPKLLNFDKMRAIADLMFKFDKYQQIIDKYTIPPTDPDSWRQHYLHQLPILSDDQLEECSLKCEPS